VTPCILCVQAPQPVRPWGDDVIRDARKFGSSCPQMIFESDDRLDPRDEDCLYLNVYSPYQVSSACESVTAVEKWFWVRPFQSGSGDIQTSVANKYYLL